MEFVYQLCIGVLLMGVYTINFIKETPWYPDLVIILVSVLLVVLLMVLILVIVACTGRNKGEYEPPDHEGYKSFDQVRTESDYVTMPLSYVKNFNDMTDDRIRGSTYTVDTEEEFGKYDKINQVPPATEIGHMKLLTPTHNDPFYYNR